MPSRTPPAELGSPLLTAASDSLIVCLHQPDRHAVSQPASEVRDSSQVKKALMFSLKARGGTYPARASSPPVVDAAANPTPLLEKLLQSRGTRRRVPPSVRLRPTPRASDLPDSTACEDSSESDMEACAVPKASWGNRRAPPLNLRPWRRISSSSATSPSDLLRVLGVAAISSMRLARGLFRSNRQTSAFNDVPFQCAQGHFPASRGPGAVKIV